MQYVVDGGVVEQFAGMIVALAAHWDARISEMRIRSYAQELSGIPWPALLAACERCKDGRFFPTTGEIKAHVRPPDDDAALLAWSAFARAATDVGAWADVDVEDGAAAEALANTFGSWPEFCAMPDGPGLALRRQEFLAHYRLARRRGAPARRLRGLCAGEAGPLRVPLLVGRVTALGAVRLVQDDARRLGDGDGHERARLPEGRAAKDEEGA